MRVLGSCPASSLHNFVIPTGAKRSGEPALSEVEGDLVFPCLSLLPAVSIWCLFPGEPLAAGVVPVACLHGKVFAFRGELDLVITFVGIFLIGRVAQVVLGA